MKKYGLITCCTLLLGWSATMKAQGTPMPIAEESEMETPMMTDKRDQGTMLEFGITPVYSWLSSDVTSKGGYGLGIHARKSLDHLFSLRLDALYARSKGDNGGPDDNNRRHDTDWYSGTAFGVVTLNNFKFKGDIRKVNLYLMAGAGFNFFGSQYQAEGFPFNEDRNPSVDKEFQTHAAFGTGINFRVSPRFNIGVEYQALIPLGNRADLVDGYNKDAGNFRDVQNIAGISLNFNIGNSDRLNEPAYWVNAFSPIKDDITNLNRRVDEATTDSDGDGVVNSVDQEADTPSGVQVDSRGRTLDSDKDGVPDYRDLEPFFPPRSGEVVNADGVVTERIDAPLTQGEIQTLIDTSIAQATRDGDRNNSTRINMAGGAIYLPMISFPLNSSEVKFDDYGVLASISRVMRANPGMTLIVRGYTDKTGNMDYNTRLSYRRALSVITHLVDNSGIERERLILQYRGQEEAIVPRDESRVNRRVEFLTGIPGATEDTAPEGE